MKIILLGFYAMVGASQFSTDLKGNKMCPDSSTLGNVDGLFNGLAKCYTGTSLFFSTLSSVCSKTCFEATVQASQYLVKKCNITKPDKNNLATSRKELIYSLWSDRKTASVVCNDNHQGGFCLDDVINYAPQLASPEQFPSHKKLRKEQVCTECSRLIYNTFRQSPHNIPIVYYRILLKPEETLKKLGTFCNWY